MGRWGTTPKEEVVVEGFGGGGGGDGGQGVTLIGSPHFFLKHWAPPKYKSRGDSIWPTFISYGSSTLGTNY